MHWTIVSNAFILSFKLNWESCSSHYLEPKLNTIPFDSVVFNSEQWRDFIKIQQTNLLTRLGKLSCVAVSLKPEENWDDDDDDDDNDSQDTWKLSFIWKIHKIKYTTASNITRNANLTATAASFNASGLFLQENVVLYNFSAKNWNLMTCYFI